MRVWQNDQAYLFMEETFMDETDSAREQTMSTSETISVDLWKFFEERGAKLKESMFSVVTWIMGFAVVVLGFAVKEGFDKGLMKVMFPGMVISLAVSGLLLLTLAVIVLSDYGDHINRTFARADAARDGASSPKKIWDAGQKANGQKLPPVCRHLLGMVGLCFLGFAVLIFMALCAMIR
jgi:hypothetical protein